MALRSGKPLSEPNDCGMLNSGGCRLISVPVEFGVPVKERVVGEMASCIFCRRFGLDMVFVLKRALWSYIEGDTGNVVALWMGSMCSARGNFGVPPMLCDMARFGDGAERLFLAVTGRVVSLSGSCSKRVFLMLAYDMNRFRSTYQ